MTKKLQTKPKTALAKTSNQIAAEIWGGIAPQNFVVERLKLCQGTPHETKVYGSVAPGAWVATLTATQIPDDERFVLGAPDPYVQIWWKYDNASGMSGPVAARTGRATRIEGAAAWP